MNRKLLGLCAAVAMVGAGGAFAQSDVTDDNSTYRRDQAGDVSGKGADIGTDSSMQGRSSSTASNNELTGTVVKISGKTLWMEHMGAVVPLKIGASTRFDDPSIKRVKDLKEGQEIRASFVVQGKTTNVAQSISLSNDTSGRGGSGFKDQVNDQGVKDQGVLDQRGTLDDKSGVIDERGSTGADQDLDHGSMNRPMDPNSGTGGSGIDHGSDIGSPDVGRGGSGIDDSNMGSGSSSVPGSGSDVGSSSGNSGQTGSGSSSDQRTY